MESEHFVGKIAQKVIIEKDGNILLIRDPREPRIIWELPGGRLDENEHPIAGIKREIKEELGLDIEPGIIVAAEPHDHNGPHISLIYVGTMQHPEQQLTLQEGEIAEVKWADRAELKNLPIYPEHARALEVYFNLGDK